MVEILNNITMFMGFILFIIGFFIPIIIICCIMYLVGSDLIKMEQTTIKEKFKDIVTFIIVQWFFIFISLAYITNVLIPVFSPIIDRFF